MTEQAQTKTLQEEIRELEEKAGRAVDAAAAAREDENTAEEERRWLDEEAAQALDAAEAAKARLNRSSEVNRAVQDRQEEREQERRAAEAEEIRRGHEQRYRELTTERRKLEERAEEEAAKLRSTLEELLDLDKEHRNEYTMSGGTLPLASTPFKAQVGSWFREAFGRPFNTGPVSYGGTDPYSGAGLVERDGWAREKPEPSKISPKTA